MIYKLERELEILEAEAHKFRFKYKDIEQEIAQCKQRLRNQYSKKQPLLPNING